MKELVETLHRLNEAGSPYVLVTLTAIRGSAPQIVGSKMLVAKDGLIRPRIVCSQVEVSA